MKLAHHYGANRIRIVNVGRLKSKEAPTEFFLRLARNPDALPKEKIGNYTRLRAERELCPEPAAGIADIVSKYSKYNALRKLELLTADTFSLIHYREAERVSEAWSDLVGAAEGVYKALPEEKRDAFFDLVLYPTKASATVAELYMAAGRNQLFAKQGRLHSWSR